MPDTSYVNVYSTLVGETDVDLIDLSFGAPVKTYISANGEYLGTLLTGWNDWIKKLGSHLTTLVTVGTEPGIAALSTVINTSHQRTATPPLPTLQVNSPTTATMQKQVSKKDVLTGNPGKPSAKGAALDRKKMTIPRPEPLTASEFYQNVVITSLTSTSPFYAPIFRYTRTFVNPSTVGVQSQSAENTLSFQQTYQVEPNRLYMNDAPVGGGSANGQVVVDSAAAAAAFLDVKTNLAAESEVEIELKEMAAKGEGGFFTSLAGMIGDAVGVPEIRSIANTVGKFVDI